MDLSKVTLPTFVLEPRSMLERITNFMSHPDLLLAIPKTQDSLERFIQVCRFYLSGWHIHPPGVKKPLNPVLGETYRAKWEFENNTKALYIAEQVSHHPPISAYFYFSPENNLRIDGVLKPRSKFMGNSAGTIMEGEALLTLMNYPNELYVLTQPNMYVRGILFGKMKFELGDTSIVRCDKNDLIAEIDFKSKGYFSGSYNTVQGKIKRITTGQVLYHISGKWSEKLFISDANSGKRKLLFDAEAATPVFGKTRSLGQQEDKESEKLWKATADAIKNRDMNLATKLKTKIEEEEREIRKYREANNIVWKLRFFKRTQSNNYLIKLKFDPRETPKQMLERVVQFAPV